jgi:hypothetical protein
MAQQRVAQIHLSVLTWLEAVLSKGRVMNSQLILEVSLQQQNPFVFLMDCCSNLKMQLEK